ncbi:MAG TPA: heparan-alpha-glucosaminide N-acetyltransferase domain-containing protein [Ferruginibacter sp.]|nr:heparan-alpha-glucosaminide N-acetyltransferase domain-containing protein [Ferruginibacter sp.]
MKQRILSLDLARGFTVMFIAPVHTMLLFSRPSVHESWLGWIFRFVSEGPGAQLFMMLMGISFALSGKKESKLVMKRAFQILAVGYLLNLLKFGLPFIFGLLPESLLKYLEVSNDRHGFIQLLFTGDILQLAGISLIVLLACSKLFAYRFLYFVFAVIICFVSPLVWDLISDHFVFNAFLQLVGGQPPRVFFPLFPWLVYPVFGVYIGYLLKGGIKIRIPKLWIGTIIIACLGIIVYHFLNSKSEGSFYRTFPVDTCFHLLLVLVWLYAWQLISKWVPANRFFDLLCWLSKHITVIYFVQWVFIFWLLPVFGFQSIGFLGSVGLMVLATFNVWGIVYIIDATSPSYPSPKGRGTVQ